MGHSYPGSLLNTDAQAPLGRSAVRARPMFSPCPGDSGPGGVWKLLGGPVLRGPEDKHVLGPRSPAVLICGELAQFLALDYPTKLSPGGF